MKDVLDFWPKIDPSLPPSSADFLLCSITLNSPLGVPKKVPILGIKDQRKTNSPLIDDILLSWHQFSCIAGDVTRRG